MLDVRSKGKVRRCFSKTASITREIDGNPGHGIVTGMHESKICTMFTLDPSSTGEVKSQPYIQG